MHGTWMKDIRELSEPSLQLFYKCKIIPKKAYFKREMTIFYRTPAERLFSATSSGERAMSPKDCKRKQLFHNNPTKGGRRPSTDGTELTTNLWVNEWSPTVKSQRAWWRAGCQGLDGAKRRLWCNLGRDRKTFWDVSKYTLRGSYLTKNKN